MRWSSAQRYRISNAEVASNWLRIEKRKIVRPLANLSFLTREKKHDKRN